MHLRALIVLLLAMNLGVALWWALRPAPGPEPAPDVPADVSRLVLVSEAGAGTLETAALNAANASAANANLEVPEPQAGAQAQPASDLIDRDNLRCFSFGPWPGAAQAEAAAATLGAQAVHMREREEPTGARGWRVMLPPLADREAAQAAVARLLEAGFDDHFILGQGDEANAIALGRFGSQSSARRHESALREAGFEAVAEPLGATGNEVWIDLAADEGFDAGQAREAAGAARADPIDCSRLQ